MTSPLRSFKKVSHHQRISVNGLQPAAFFIEEQSAIAHAVAYERGMEAAPKPAPNQSGSFIAPDLHHQCGDNLLARGGTAIIGSLIRAAGNTLCINENFGKIWRERCKPDVRGEILNRLLYFSQNSKNIG